MSNIQIEFTNNERNLLTQIYHDKYAIGGFSGMIFNKWVEQPDSSIDYLLKRALQVRMRIGELVKEFEEDTI